MKKRRTKPGLPLSERLEFHSIPVPECGCQIWTGSVTGSGYGHIRHNRQEMRTHRAAWELKNGPVPDGLCVLHRCDIPTCINPDHLFLGTLTDNMVDMVAKGRGWQPCGEDNPRSKLKIADVLYIRSSSESLKKLAKKFGVDPSTISFARNRKMWAHI